MKILSKFDDFLKILPNNNKFLDSFSCIFSNFQTEVVDLNDEKDHMDSPNLLHMGLSKQTLETLGITLGKKTVNNVENVEHQGITYVIQTFS